MVKVRCHWRPDLVGMPGRWRTYVCGDRVEARRRNPRYAPPWRPSTPGVVRGPLLHCHVLVDRSADLVVAVQQRSELVAKITVLLRRLGWFGFVGLMFIVGADGVPQLVDFNGRIPMSFQQSIAACPQLPDLWARVAAGRSPDQAVTSWSRRCTASTWPALLDPLRTPLFAPAKSVARLVAAELGRLPQGRVRPTRHPSWSVQRRLRRSGLLPIRQATVGFGPFTYLGKTLLPDNHAIRVEQALQRRADSHSRLLRSTGRLCLVLARKPDPA